MKAQVVSFHCVLSDKLGKIISSTFNRDVITYSKHSGELLQGLAEGLQDLKIGEKRRIFLSADQAYGFYDPDLVVEIPLANLPRRHALLVGQELVAKCENGESKVMRVIQIMPGSTILDGNHPLAGQDLVFDIEAVDARDATSEELMECSPGSDLSVH